jgi:ribulose-phosphate 3-epimerase
MSFLNPIHDARLKASIYRLRFLVVYVIIGFSSILIELIFRNYLIGLNLSDAFSTIFAITIGIIFAFFTNVKFNFKILSARRNRALIYFLLISFFSGALQFFLREYFSFANNNYEMNRLLISSIVFTIAYMFHRKFSFRDFKKVGVAIYANGVEDFNNIHNLIGQYSDFIHVDIVDKSMSKNAEEVKAYRLETMKAYWPKTQVQTHIMSKTPSVWLKQIMPYSDVIYVHAECDENILDIFEEIKSYGKKPGLAMMLSTNVEDKIELLEVSEYVLLLTIANPGKSGQKFDLDGVSSIKKINSLPFRNQFSLCVDGGVNEDIIKLIEAEYVVSGSSVLKNSNPKRQIMRLQTQGRYDS